MTFANRVSALLSAALPFAALLGAARPVFGQMSAEVLPDELDVSIVQKLNAQIPLDLEFKDELGRAVKLADLFSKRPVVLTLNYFRCPSLCGVQLDSLLETLRDLKWNPGEQFEIITLSFDPLEEPPLARAKKQTYLNELGRPSAGKGWHFLTGKRDAIKALTATVGFGYKWNPDRNEWAHAAALIICSPEGRVSRYLDGIAYNPQSLRLSLVEASEGKVGSLADRLFLTCYRYDPNSRSYVMVASNVMKTGGVLSVLVLGVFVLGLWRYEARRRRRSPAPAGLQTTDGVTG